MGGVTANISPSTKEFNKGQRCAACGILYLLDDCISKATAT